MTVGYTFAYNALVDGVGTGPLRYFTGTTPSSDLVPALFPVALAGRPYILDDALVGEGMWKHESIPLLREQFDASKDPGEASVNPAGYWRRAQDSWELGVGQNHFDRETSEKRRYRSSKRLEPFTTNWQISLSRKPSVYDASTFAPTDKVTSSGTYLFASLGTVLYRSPDAGTALSMFFDFGSTITSLQSDGYWVYVAAGTELYRFPRDAATPGTAWSSGPIYYELATVKDRVLAASENLLYEIDSAGIERVIYTGPNTDWRVADITETEGFIFFGGGSGDKHSIYTVDVLDDGTGLAPAQVAAELPEGETILAVKGYLGFLFIGVNGGVRLGSPSDSEGDVTLGALIDIGHKVGSFEGQGSIVTFEWENFDGVSSGLGEFDLSTFTDAERLVPAYAFTMAVDGATFINQITRRENVLYFIAGTVGLMEVSSDSLLEDEGYFESGWVDWNLVSEEKQLTWLRLDTNGEGSYIIEIRSDDDPFQPLAQVDTKRNRIPLELRGIRFEYRVTLVSPDGIEAPVVFGVGLESYVAADTTSYITVPLIIAEGIVFEGGESYLTVAEEVEFLKSLRETRNLTTYQEGPTKYTVICEDYIWLPDSMIDAGAERGVHNGTFVAILKVIDRALGTAANN